MSLRKYIDEQYILSELPSVDKFFEASDVALKEFITEKRFSGGTKTQQGTDDTKQNGNKLLKVALISALVSASQEEDFIKETGSAKLMLKKCVDGMSEWLSNQQNTKVKDAIMAATKIIVYCSDMDTVQFIAKNNILKQIIQFQKAHDAVKMSTITSLSEKLGEQASKKYGQLKYQIVNRVKINGIDFELEGMYFCQFKNKLSILVQGVLDDNVVYSIVQML